MLLCIPRLSDIRITFVALSELSLNLSYLLYAGRKSGQGLNYYTENWPKQWVMNNTKYY